jgi:hypothetical protein
MQTYGVSIPVLCCLSNNKHRLTHSMMLRYNIPNFRTDFREIWKRYVSLNFVDICEKCFKQSFYKNKKLWEELIAYFPFIRHGSHRKQCLQQFFVAGTSLPSYYLETIWGYTGPQTHMPNNSSIFACICFRRNVFTEPLPSNERRNTFYRAFA